jgi:ABC-type multidrug transport system permease subunit
MTSTTTTRTAIQVPARPTTPMAQLRWGLSDTWTLTLRGINHWIRQPLPVIGGMAFMVMLVALYGFLFGGAMSVPGGGNYLEFLMPGMFVMTMAFGIGETMSLVAADADRGVTDRFRSMPMAPSAVLLGRSLTDMIYASVGLAVMIGAGLLLGWRWHGGVGDTAAAIGLLLLLRFAMLWVGMYLGLLVPSPAAVTSVSTLLFPLTMVTVAFAASETMPAWLGFIAEVNPLSATIYATRDLFGNPGGHGTSLVAQNAELLAIVWPLLIVAVFAPLAMRRYRSLSR